MLRIIVGDLLYLFISRPFGLNVRRSEGLLDVLNGIRQSLHHCILTRSGYHLVDFATNNDEILLWQIHLPICHFFIVGLLHPVDRPVCYEAKRYSLRSTVGDNLTKARSSEIWGGRDGQRENKPRTHTSTKTNISRLVERRKKKKKN